MSKFKMKDEEQMCSFFPQDSIFQPFIMGSYMNVYQVKYFEIKFWVQTWEVFIIIK